MTRRQLEAPLRAAEHATSVAGRPACPSRPARDRAGTRRACPRPAAVRRARPRTTVVPTATPTSRRRRAMARSPRQRDGGDGQQRRNSERPPRGPLRRGIPADEASRQCPAAAYVALPGCAVAFAPIGRGHGDADDGPMRIEDFELERSSPAMSSRPTPAVRLGRRGLADGRPVALATRVGGSVARLRWANTEAPGCRAAAEIATLYESVAPDEVLVFSGAEEAIFVLATCCSTGDHAIVVCPSRPPRGGPATGAAYAPRAHQAEAGSR